MCLLRARRAIGAIAFLFGVPILATSALQAQASAPRFDNHAVAPSATAVRTTQAPSIDGRLDDEVWNTAPVISELYQLDPNEGEPVSERTEVRILYDDYNLYIGAWLYDTGPLTGRLGRRDSAWPDTDGLLIFLDSYHDHRTAYRFTLNPSGTRRDEVISGGGGGRGGGGIGGFGGGGGRGGGGRGGSGRGGGGLGGGTGTGTGDATWDPVWESATTVDSEGWYAEMRIPFSQLRYSQGDVQTWGLQIDRRIGRLGEHSSWSFTPRDERATVARFGHLTGVSGIQSSGRLELLPFAAARAEYRDIPRISGVDFDNPFRNGSDYFMNAGMDLKYRLTSNITLDATVNPDFGQVEMDPAEINLTAFETRLGERRPFFVEGAEIFSFGEGGGFGTQLLYTRRIGRVPQLSMPRGTAYSDAPGSTTILGAFKVTGKTPSGWSLGLLDAVTNREKGQYLDSGGTRHERVIEPLSNYFVGRARRDLNEGQSAFGFFGTSVVRRLDGEEALASRLPSTAVTGGIDFRHEWSERAWRFSGQVSSSSVHGDSSAIRRLQRSSARYFHRPDALHLEVDEGATMMAGYSGQMEIAKQSGQWRGSADFTATSPSYEVNDLGFQISADRLELDGSIAYEQPRPGARVRRWDVRAGTRNGWNYGGDRVAKDVNLSGSMQFTSFHGVNARISRTFESWNDRFTRGGPLTIEPAAIGGSLGFNTDNRRQLTFRGGVSLIRDDVGSDRTFVNTALSWRPTDAHEIQIGPSFNRSHTVAQYVTAIDDPTARQTEYRRYVFAPLDQTTFSINTRLSMTFSPALTLEIFAEPFISSGSYDVPIELEASRTFAFREYGSDAVRSADGRYTIDPDGAGPAEPFEIADPDFNYQSLLGNAVLRWEWRPGSTIFVVWQQSRSERLTAALGESGRRPGDFDFEKDTRALFGLDPDNVFMIKFNYWLNR